MDVALHEASEEKLARIRNQFVGFIFQSFQLLPSLTALENVMVPAEISGENRARQRAGNCWDGSASAAGCIIIRPSFPAASSSGSPSRAPS